VPQVRRRQPEGRAETLVHLPAAPERAATTGAFWAYMRPGRTSTVSQDGVEAEKLWRTLEQIAALMLYFPCRRPVATNAKLDDNRVAVRAEIRCPNLLLPDGSLDKN